MKLVGMMMNKLIIAALLVLGLSGCGDNQYDQLRVVDGEGIHYLLVHNIGDSYFVRNLSTNSKAPTRNSKANAKLRGLPAQVEK